eukprot:6177997-Pleurochrysis_carterae.AAC.4
MLRTPAAPRRRAAALHSIACTAVCITVRRNARRCAGTAASLKSEPARIRASHCTLPLRPCLGLSRCSIATQPLITTSLSVLFKCGRAWLAGEWQWHAQLLALVYCTGTSDDESSESPNSFSISISMRQYWLVTLLVATRLRIA